MKIQKKNIDKSLTFRFDYVSFLIFLLIFVIEVCIALFVDDKIIRPYGGDFLVVIMIYYFLKSFIKTKKSYLLLGVLLFAYTVELAQLLNTVSILGLENNKIMSTVIGTSFSWGDLVAYTLGTGTCWLIESKIKQN